MMLASRSHSSSSGTPKVSRRKSNESKSNKGSSGSKKQVRFYQDDSFCTIHPIPARSQFAKNQKRTCWYNHEDYHMISQENNNILKFMMIGGSGIKHVETAVSTTRGLEAKTLEGAEHKKISILDGLCAVLLEQERQRQKDVVDEERIREAYLVYTQVPAMVAAKQGKMDFQATAPEAVSFGKTGKNKQKSFDMQSTDTTLVSDETATNADSMMSGDNEFDSVKKSRSIVKRLLKGRMFTKQRRKASAAAYKLGV